MRATADSSPDSTLPGAPGTLMRVLALGAIAWGAIVVVGFGQLLASLAARELRLDMTDVLRMHAPPFVFWWLMTPVIFALQHRLRAIPLGVATTFGVHAAVAIAVAAIPSALAVLVATTSPNAPWRPLWPQYVALVGLRYSFDLLTYIAIAAVAVSIRLRRRALRQAQVTASLEAELADTRLRALTAQLHPHFLFNALNGVAMLIRGGEHVRALRAVEGYGELLRVALDDETADVPLDEELRFVSRYLEIEQMRFPDLLDVAIEASDEASAALVPRLLLQPLVENAVKHGLMELERPGRIAIAAARRDGRLRVEVRDDGAGLREGWERSRALGVGLRNTERRLRQRFGDDFLLELRRQDDGGVSAVVEVPFVRAPGRVLAAEARRA